MYKSRKNLINERQVDATYLARYTRKTILWITLSGNTFSLNCNFMRLKMRLEHLNWGLYRTQKKLRLPPGSACSMLYKGSFLQDRPE